MSSRIDATDAALAMIDRLRQLHGPLIFHQSGGCCDGSAPMCYRAGEFRIGKRDIKLGEIGGAPFYMEAAQFEYSQNTHITIDAAPGRGASFSLETPEGVRFLTRSCLLPEPNKGRTAEDERVQG